MSIKTPLGNGKGHALLSNSAGRDNQIAVIRALRNFDQAAASSTEWRGMSACPPNSILETVVQAFRKETNIPLEIPFAFVLAMISWRLVQSKAMLVIPNQEEELDIWLTVLAASGSGKTLTHKLLSSIFKITSTFGEPVSAAAWVENLADVGGRTFWLKDEWGQMIRQILDLKSPLAEVRGYMLRAKDHDSISRRKVEQFPVSVEHPTIVFLGFSVTGTWHQCVNWEAMTDGLGQRFLYLLANPDPERPWKKYPRYKLHRIAGPIKRKANRFLSTKIQSRYQVSHGAHRVYDEQFAQLASDDLSESFFRRAMWRCYQLAVIYHVILEKESAVIDVEDMRYATQAVRMMLGDAYKVIQLVDSSDFLRLVDKAEVWISGQRAKGRPINPRTLMQNVRGIKSKPLADHVLKMLKHPTDHQT